MGVTAVRGEFAANQPVQLLDPDGEDLGRGLCSMDSDQLRAAMNDPSPGSPPRWWCIAMVWCSQPLTTSTIRRTALASMRFSTLIKVLQTGDAGLRWSQPGLDPWLEGAASLDQASAAQLSF